MTNETRPWCCQPGCGKDAVFNVREERTDLAPCDCSSHACADHVGEMLGTSDHGDPDVEVHHWIVSTLAALAPPPKDD